jgi:hypothetical protein
MFIKLTNGAPKNYTIGQLRRDNPQVSFPKDIPAEVLATFDVHPVKRTSAPEHDTLTQLIRAIDPLQVDGEWVQQWEILGLPEDQAAENVRAHRGYLLSETDWMALSDNTMTPAWADYRQALRDLTAQEDFPYSVVWPTKP